MNGADVSPITINKEMSTRTSTMGMSHHALLAEANAKRSFKRLNRCFIKFIVIVRRLGGC
jgi:hypothetical protein